MKHLEMIQGVINRLSTNSFLLKGWSVVLVSALFALSAKDRNPAFVYLACFPALALWALDGYFLWQERLYRALYNMVRAMKEDEIDFSMDTFIVRETTPNWIFTVFSKTLLMFHGLITATIIVVMLYIAIN